MLKRLKEGEGDNRGWDGWMASPTQWTWVWASSRRWWGTGKLGVLWVHGVAKSHQFISRLLTTPYPTQLSWKASICSLKLEDPDFFIIFNYSKGPHWVGTEQPLKRTFHQWAASGGPRLPYNKVNHFQQQLLARLYANPMNMQAGW